MAEMQGLGKQSRSVLILEDDVELREVLERFIHKSCPNVGVVWATTLDEGLKVIHSPLSWKDGRLDLILADIFLPNLELGTKILDTRILGMRGIPIAFMSSIEPQGYLNLLASQTNPPPFLRKPIILKDLKIFLETVLR